MAELLLSGGRALVSTLDADLSLWSAVITFILHILFVITRNCHLFCFRHWFGPRGVVAATAALALLHGRHIRSQTKPSPRLGRGPKSEVGQLAERFLLTLASRCPIKLSEVFKPRQGFGLRDGTRHRHGNRLRAVWKRLRERHSLLSVMADESDPLRRLEVG